jgi:hypothetical protein
MSVRFAPIAVVALVLCIGAGCGAADGSRAAAAVSSTSPAAETSVSDPSVDSRWVSIDGSAWVFDEVEHAPGQLSMIRLSHGDVVAVVGCLTVRGQYSSSESGSIHLSLPDIDNARCFPGVHADEIPDPNESSGIEPLLARLEAARSYTSDDRSLELIDANGAVVVAARRAVVAEELSNTEWQIVGITSDTDASDDIAPGYLLRFDAEGIAIASGPCGRIELRLFVDGNRVTIFEGASQAVECPDRVIDRFGKVVHRTTGWTIEENSLVLIDSAGSRLVLLAPR